MSPSVSWISSFTPVNLLVFWIFTNDSDDVRGDEFDDSKEWLPLESLRTRKKHLSRKRYLFFLSLFTVSFFIDYYRNLFTYLYWCPHLLDGSLIDEVDFPMPITQRSAKVGGCQLNTDSGLEPGILLFFRVVSCFMVWSLKENSRNWKNRTIEPDSDSTVYADVHSQVFRFIPGLRRCDMIIFKASVHVFSPLLFQRYN